MTARNAEWAEQAVRRADNLAAAEALNQGVIDLIATDVADLLVQLDGRAVQILGTATTLHTTGVVAVEIAPGWRTRILGVLTDPNIAYILLMIGLAGQEVAGWLGSTDASRDRRWEAGLGALLTGFR